MKRLFAVIRSRGPAWDPSRPLEGQPDWQGHAAFMNGLKAEGFVVLGGPLEGTPEVLLIDRVAIPFYVSGLVGGPAYVPFAAVLLWWIRKAPVERYRAISWIAPLLFVPPFLLYLFVTRWWTGSTAPLLDTLIFYGLLVL